MTRYRNAWLPTALLVGAIYCLIGRVFALPFENVRLARGAAWLLSGALFMGHIGYEHFKLHSTPKLAATHVAAAVGIGAAGLALAGMLHSLLTTSVVRPVWFIALLVLPVLVATPAYLVGLFATTLLTRSFGTAARRRPR
jgi:hypothetical protein